MPGRRMNVITARLVRRCLPLPLSRPQTDGDPAAVFIPWDAGHRFLAAIELQDQTTSEKNRIHRCVRCKQTVEKTEG